MNNTLHVVGFSGGIDSQACARWVLDRFPKEQVLLLNSDAGGNEHRLTTEFIHEYSEKIHPVVTISALIQDLGGRGTRPGKIHDRRTEYRDTDRMTFDAMAYIIGRFPSRTAQFCTEILKLIPQKRYIDEVFTDIEVIRYSGIRWQESADRRATYKPEQWDDFFDCSLVCPILDWDKDQCFDSAKNNNEPINELYRLGFTRVGCAPCVNSNKDDIAAWAARSPEIIDKIRTWEKRVGATFFAPCVPGRRINWVDEVVEWAQTVHGGKQRGLQVLYSRPACESKYGLCE